jgi:hypothetical protein
MIKHLITGGCSFSHYANSNENWIGFLEDKLKFANENLTTEHTGYFSQGQELIQKKVMLAIVEALESGLQPNEIMTVVMWSGTFRKAWYIDNPIIIKQMTKLWNNFDGGMSSQFLDLKNRNTENPNYFKTKNGSKFSYNKNGGWYFTVNGSDSQMEFVQQHYILDGHMTDGIGKIHSSIENIIMLQNFCKLNGINFYQQFFMDSVFEDVENNKNHQMINYLYNQLDENIILKNGMFEYLHTLLNIDRKESINITHSERLKLDENTGYFSNDGFHPSKLGAELWCKNVLFPFLFRS